MFNLVHQLLNPNAILYIDQFHLPLEASLISCLLEIIRTECFASKNTDTELLNLLLKSLPLLPVLVELCTLLLNKLLEKGDTVTDLRNLGRSCSVRTLGGGLDRILWEGFGEFRDCLGDGIFERVVTLIGFGESLLEGAIDFVIRSCGVRDDGLSRLLQTSC